MKNNCENIYDDDVDGEKKKLENIGRYTLSSVSHSHGRRGEKRKKSEIFREKEKVSIVIGFIQCCWLTRDSSTRSQPVDRKWAINVCNLSSTD